MGHAEGASGIVDLIKVIMMMQDIFNKMNHLIDARRDDMIEVSTVLRSRDEEHRMVLINKLRAIQRQSHCRTGAAADAPSDDQNHRRERHISFLDLWPRSPGHSAYSAKLACYCRSLPKEFSTLPMFLLPWPAGLTARCRRATYSAAVPCPSWRSSVVKMRQNCQR